MSSKDRVRIKGTVSKETAEAMKRGDLESNNGLRKAKGRRSWNPEQPDFELDETPEWADKLKTGIRHAITDAIIDEIDYSLRYRIFPAIGNTIQNKIIPFLVDKWNQRKETSPHMTTDCNHASEVKGASKRTNVDNVIDFNDRAKKKTEEIARHDKFGAI